MYHILLFFLMDHLLAWSLFSSESTEAETIDRAEYHTPEKQQGEPPACLSEKEQERQNRFTCPSVRELYKKNMRWRTDTGWKGYQDSFANKISHFMGAQWKGVGIGRVICIYKSDDENDFPVQIATTELVSRPVYAYWDNHPNSDLLNCISKNSDPCDCQFSFYKVEKETNIDEIISGIEKK